MTIVELMTIRRIICVTAIWAIMPAISFAKQQGLAALQNPGPVIISWADTIPQQVNQGVPTAEPAQKPVVKKVPKSRRQVSPAPLPKAPVKPIIKPKIINPVIKVKLN